LGFYGFTLLTLFHTRYGLDIEQYFQIDTERFTTDDILKQVKLWLRFASAQLNDGSGIRRLRGAERERELGSNSVSDSNSYDALKALLPAALSGPRRPSKERGFKYVPPGGDDNIWLPEAGSSMLISSLRHGIKCENTCEDYFCQGGSMTFFMLMERHIVRPRCS
jgi:hypothetical protein